jgi:hypothetical protein
MFRRNSLPVPSHDEYPSQSILLNPLNPSRPSQSPHKSPSVHIENAASSSQQITDDGTSTSNSNVSSSPHGSTFSLASTSYGGTNGSSSTKVSFAPLPVVPPELKRRNSITLGVAARKNLLTQQGSAPPRAPGAGQNSGGVRKVYMTDAEWEAYKKSYEDKNGSVGPRNTGEAAAERNAN